MKKPKEIPVILNGKQIYRIPEGDMLVHRVYDKIRQGFPIEKVYYIKCRKRVYVE